MDSHQLAGENLISNLWQQQGAEGLVLTISLSYHLTRPSPALLLFRVSAPIPGSQGQE